MTATITLLWIPLGAGAHVVRVSGATYERIVARRDHRTPQPLFHAALALHTSTTEWTIELAPQVGSPAPREAIAMQGPVGARWGGRFAALRYELRVWEHGTIDDRADVTEIVELPATDARIATIVSVAPALPPLTWGRDEASTGDMWNSNSAISWLLTHGGVDARQLAPPDGGRAPGWAAGLAVALSA